MQEQQPFRRIVSDGQFLSHCIGSDLRLIGVSDVAASGSGNACMQERPMIEADSYDGVRLSGFSEDGDAAYYSSEQGGVSGCSDIDDELG